MHHLRNSEFTFTTYGFSLNTKVIQTRELLLATFLKTEILTEKRQHMILETIGHFARMRAGINFERACDSILIKDIVQFARIHPQAVLVANIERNGAILVQISDVLIDEGQRRIRRPFCENIRLGLAVFRWQVKIKRWILRIRRPCRCRGKLRAGKERQLG